MALVLLLLAVSTVVVASDPPPPSDIRPNITYYNVAESSTRFRRNVARAYAHLFSTVPTKGPTEYRVGSRSNTVYSYGQCYNITGLSCGRCLNETAVAMGDKWLGARRYSKGSDSGCFLRYESYAFVAEAPQPSAPPATAPISPVLPPPPSVPPAGASFLAPSPQRSGGLDPARGALITVVVATAVLCLSWT